MTFCAGIHRFRDGLPDHIARVTAGEEIVLYIPGHTLLMEPIAGRTGGHPLVSVSAFRPRAGQWLRRATREPIVLTWYGRPVATLRSAPDAFQPVRFDEIGPHE